MKKKKQGDTWDFEKYYKGFFGGRAFRWLDKRKLSKIKDTLNKLDAGLRVIDIGCGSGQISSKLIRLFPGIEIIGVDKDQELLKLSKERGLKTKLVDFNKPLPFEANYFDVALMIDTIEHVKSRQEIFSQVKRVLKTHSILIVFTPPYDTFTWLLGLKLHTLITRRDTFDHISPFTKEALSWFLKENFIEWEVGRINLGLSMYGIARGKRN